MEQELLYAGDTWTWERSVDADFSAADGWGLKYILTNAAGKITFTDDGTATSSKFTVLVAAATTAAYTAGDYTAQLFAVKGTDRRYIGKSVIKVLADVAEESSLDMRSHVKKTLDALEAALEGKASSDQQSISINGRSISRLSPTEQRKWRADYLSQYRAEQAAEKVRAGKGNPNTVKIHFTGA